MLHDLGWSREASCKFSIAAVQWLVLHGNVQVPQDTSLAAACADGTLLVRLMRSCGHRDLRAGHREPSNRAQALMNVRCVLECLRLDCKMPPRHLWSQDALVRGEPGEAEGLLWDMFAVQHRLL